MVKKKSNSILGSINILCYEYGWNTEYRSDQRDSAAELERIQTAAYLVEEKSCAGALYFRKIVCGHNRDA